MITLIYKEGESTLLSIKQIPSAAFEIVKDYEPLLTETSLHNEEKDEWSTWSDLPLHVADELMETLAGKGYESCLVELKAAVEKRLEAHIIDTSFEESPALVQNAPDQPSDFILIQQSCWITAGLFALYIRQGDKDSLTIEVYDVDPLSGETDSECRQSFTIHRRNG